MAWLCERVVDRLAGPAGGQPTRIQTWHKGSERTVSHSGDMCQSNHPGEKISSKKKETMGQLHVIECAQNPAQNDAISDK